MVIQLGCDRVLVIKFLDGVRVSSGATDEELRVFLRHLLDDIEHTRRSRFELQKQDCLFCGADRRECLRQIRWSSMVNGYALWLRFRGCIRRKPNGGLAVDVGLFIRGAITSALQVFGNAMSVICVL